MLDKSYSFSFANNRDYFEEDKSYLLIEGGRYPSMSSYKDFLYNLFVYNQILLNNCIFNYTSFIFEKEDNVTLVRGMVTYSDPKTRTGALEENTKGESFHFKADISFTEVESNLEVVFTLIPVEGKSISFVINTSKKEIKDIILSTDTTKDGYQYLEEEDIPEFLKIEKKREVKGRVLDSLVKLDPISPTELTPEQIEQENLRLQELFKS